MVLLEKAAIKMASTAITPAVAADLLVVMVLQAQLAPKVLRVQQEL
jgi:hypothetical protein